jgi:arylsulfatase A-like enzyme
MSPTLGCYGDAYATTPHIDRLANESVRYTRAFATAPVCSPSRCCLITGCYAPSLGTQQMRSAFSIPKSMRGFPHLMRADGFYTTNNVKTDYNTANAPDIIAASWDESSETAHWRKRTDAAQPFFSVFNFMVSHQSRSMAWTRDRFLEEVQSQLSAAEIHEPDDVTLPPYYPDTLVVRRTVARYYDCVTVLDQQVGDLLQQLEDDGLADDTIVFFFSDHGSGMPRHKRCLFDSGMHVPLLIRFPEKYANLAPCPPGQTTDRLVSFVDFAPTVLELAQVEVPTEMQGQAFLGPRADQPRDYVFGHRDRIDEAMDVARSVRDDRYLYIRNYMPHLGYNQPRAWPDMGEISEEFYRLAEDPRATSAQRQFVGPSRPVEELYDCATDPNNLHNLVDSSPHQSILLRLRAAHQRHLQETRDLGFLPESLAWVLSDGSTPWELARSGDLDVGATQRAAALVGKATERKLLDQFEHPNSVVRYWSAIGLAARSSVSPEGREALQTLLDDEVPAVRVAAADALARHGDSQLAMPCLIRALKDDDLNVVLHAARVVELLGSDALAATSAMQHVVARAERLRPPDTPAGAATTPEQDLAWFCSFTANAFLARTSEDPWVRLFDGESLAGWEARANGEVTVVDGEIQLLAKGQNLWLVHDESYANFELTVDVLMPFGQYNSGIGFRCEGEQGRPRGYQCEIAAAKSGMLYAIGSGWVWPKTEQERDQFVAQRGNGFREGRWNHVRIRCEDDHIQIWINGILTADVRDKQHMQGRVALQHHGIGGGHRFRNILIREL